MNIPLGDTRYVFTISKYIIITIEHLQGVWKILSDMGSLRNFFLRSSIKAQQSRERVIVLRLSFSRTHVCLCLINYLIFFWVISTPKVHFSNEEFLEYLFSFYI